MEDGDVIIFVGGIGNLFFIMDSGVVLCVVEMKCDVFFKGMQVDGVYLEDFKVNLDVECYEILGYEEVIICNLKVMDIIVIVLVWDNVIFVIVFFIYFLGVLVSVFEEIGIYMVVSE